MDNDSSVTSPASSGGCGFNSQWNSYFVNNVRSVCMQANDSDRNMSLIQNALNWYGGAAYNQVNYVESHDEVGGPQDQSPLKTRLCKHIDWSNPHSYWAKKRSTLAGAVALLSRGIPMMFQGQEFMEDKRFEQGILNESIVNMPNWSYATTYSGIQQMYKDLITLRKTYAALRSSSMKSISR
jgi:1,4-alpha-glucan branching enzyme